MEHFELQRVAFCVRAARDVSFRIWAASRRFFSLLLSLLTRHTTSSSCFIILLAAKVNRWLAHSIIGIHVRSAIACFVWQWSSICDTILSKLFLNRDKTECRNSTCSDASRFTSSFIAESVNSQISYPNSFYAEREANTDRKWVDPQVYPSNGKEGFSGTQFEIFFEDFSKPWKTTHKRRERCWFWSGNCTKFIHLDKWKGK